MKTLVEIAVLLREVVALLKEIKDQRPAATAPAPTKRDDLGRQTDLLRVVRTRGAEGLKELARQRAREERAQKRGVR